MSDYAPDQATARADLCRFLSACYYQPAPEFAQENLFDSMRIAATRLDPVLGDLARELGEAFAAHDLQTLLVDYTRLFLGPIDTLAKPYGSSWLKSVELTDDNPDPAVLGLYREGGFDLDAEFTDLPDHIAVELEFLYVLIFTANQAAAAGDPDKAASLTLLQDRFLGAHLGTWITPFAQAVRAGAETAFYRTLADLTERFVRMQGPAPALP